MDSIVLESTAHDAIIHETFIEPIRTVIVIDDEYPTLDSLIAKETKDVDCWKGGTTEVTRVRNLLDFARNKPKPWLVDVHDGKKVTSKSEEGIASYLHHSDLLVLDYHLDGNEGSGDAAINILRKLAESDHFNLVIVYTKGYEGDFNRVIREIALGLTSFDKRAELSDDDLKAANESIAFWEDHNAEIKKTLLDEISSETYLEARTKYGGNYEEALGSEVGKRIFSVWKNKPPEIELAPGLLMRWLLQEKQRELEAQFTTKELGELQFKNIASTNWIRTDKLFITVVSKECLPDEFEIKLRDAIKSSFPSPHRLLLTKMRTEIDQRGIAAEASILGNKLLQVEWLNDFLKVAEDHRSLISSTVGRHWESLGDRINSSLTEFAERLRKVFIEMELSKVMIACGLKVGDVGTPLPLKNFNCFSSTKPIDRSHLTTGHIFRSYHIREGDEDPNLWICLSPACDMVPDQKQRQGLVDCIPFVAVRLRKVSDKVALSNANKNIFVFITIDDKIESYSIHKDGNHMDNPAWEQAFARNNGKFHSQNRLNYGRIIETKGKLEAEWGEAIVVAQLRSEYALNLLQRLGVTLSRPGLGINFKKMAS